MIRILGIDTGMAKLGWAVIEDGKTLLGSGVLTTKKTEGVGINQDTITRLRVMAPALRGLVEEFEPWGVVLETVPPAKIQMAQRDQVIAVQTVVRLLGHDLHYAEMAAVTSKKRFTGNGHATKPEMREKCWEVFPELRESRMKGWDGYDAVALCYNGFDLPSDEWWKPVTQ